MCCPPMISKMAAIGSLRFIDIGVNFTDLMFKGIYHGKKAHEDDFDEVVKRASNVGIKKMIITAGNLSESQDALELAKTNESFYCTVGCHPTRCGEFEEEGQDPQDYLQQLITLAKKNEGKVVAVGECGLDFDRTNFCQKEVQLKYFQQQFRLAEETKLPMFLHSRNAHQNFLDIIRQNRDRFVAGVAHCFTGSKEEAAAYLDQGLYIGITGCSLKTADNIEVMKTIPSDRLLLETDAPWCDIRPTHAGFKHIRTKFESKKKEKWEKGVCVKGRNEPAHIVQVLEVVAASRGEDAQSLAEVIYDNTLNLFFS
ncbi:deoxyribonuclease TATDN1-like isoform X4 [Acropora palmata]|uniref:deoxyribonuclease TATDN1-like isoform X4 n=1 Tax=Acropora palmata TaxID=6131 RepID=UPI003D9FCBE9